MNICSTLIPRSSGEESNRSVYVDESTVKSRQPFTYYMYASDDRLQSLKRVRQLTKED